MFRIFLFYIILFVLSVGMAQPHANPVELSASDKYIYNYTVTRCQGGSVGSALLLGLSYDIRTLKSSPGFWEAMAKCYGYEYGTLNYGNLMKQIIDMGHLTQEVVTVFFFGYAISSFLAAKGIVSVAQSPAVSAVVNAGAAFLALIQAYSKLRSLLSTDSNSGEMNNDERPVVMSDAKLAVEKSKTRAQMRIAELENQIANSNQDPTTRNQLIKKKTEIENALSTLLAVRQQTGN